MVTSSFFEKLKEKNFKLKVVNKSNPWKFNYKNLNFSVCIRNISFAYRTNKDEYRVQVGKDSRTKLKDYHLNGFWGLIFGYHKKSDTFTTWDNKLLFNSRALNRSLYTRESICERASVNGLEYYTYVDNFFKEETVAITMQNKYISHYLDQIKTNNLHKFANFKIFYRNFKN